MKRLVLALVLILAPCHFTGCISTVEGDLKPGVPLMSDTKESRYKVPVDQIFDAAKEVLRFHGTLIGENRINNTLEAKIDTRRVWVSVSEVGPGVSQLRVQVRTKGGLGDKELAGELDKQIALRLR